MAYDYDLFVIGAGSGGVRASRLFPGAGFDNVIVAAATECCTQSDIKAYAAALAQVL